MQHTGYSTKRIKTVRQLQGPCHFSPPFWTLRSQATLASMTFSWIMCRTTSMPSWRIGLDMSWLSHTGHFRSPEPIAQTKSWQNVWPWHSDHWPHLQRQKLTHRQIGSVCQFPIRSSKPSAAPTPTPHGSKGASSPQPKAEVPKISKAQQTQLTGRESFLIFLAGHHCNILQSHQSHSTNKNRQSWNSESKHPRHSPISIGVWQCELQTWTRELARWLSACGLGQPVELPKTSSRKGLRHTLASAANMNIAAAVEAYC